MTQVDEVKRLLEQLTPEHRREVFRYLRQEFPIHPIEKLLNTDAEIILEAISRASDLTLRGIRGVIAEAAFATDVVSQLKGWRDTTPPGDAPYDFALEDAIGTVRVQVKLQRQVQQRPMGSEEAARWAGLPPGLYVVETQRTRGGKNHEGEATRPYRFSEFDILAVAMHPSTRNWSNFMYTVASWLLPHPRNAAWIQTYQAVSPVSNDVWTHEFLECVAWLRSTLERRHPRVLSNL
jgi:hypothetical protein